MTDQEREAQSKDQPSPMQVEYILDEIKQLSRLNSALFRWVFSTDRTDEDFFAALFDRTHAGNDNCVSERFSHVGIQGDFYLVRRVGRYAYIVAGDATGHHAYAGGLIVFLLSILQQIFASVRWWRALTAVDLLSEMNKRIVSVGRAALRDKDSEGLYGGANLIVLRIDAMSDEVLYASAGLPVYVVGPTLEPQVRQFGDFADAKGLRFPQDLQAPAPPAPDFGRLPAQGGEYLAILTDGFRALRRAPAEPDAPPKEGSDAIYGDERACSALRQSARLAAHPETRPSAKQVAERLVNSAVKFRRGHAIPEVHDDDRLVVVIDLRELRRPPEVKPVRLRMANLIAQVIEPSALRYFSRQLYKIGVWWKRI
jgi:hypothetical protein